MDYPPENREIVVVDNGSTDRTAEIVKQFPVRYVWEEKRGVATARNKGIEVSRGPIVAFTDADCLVITGWLQELLEGFEDDGVGIVAGEVVPYPPKTPVERYIAMCRPLHQVWDVSYPGFPWFATASLALRREVFNEIGLFDPRFNVAAENIDFGWRFFQSKKFRLIYRPKALVFHRLRGTARALFNQRKGYGYGQAVLRRKYPKAIHWSWQKELKAYADLSWTALALGKEAVDSVLNREKTQAFAFRYLDLVRKSAERIGFIRGNLWKASE